MSSSSPSGRKYRRCHECGAVRPATEFKLVLRGIRAADPQARCPACKHVGPRWSFAEVEPPEGGADTGSA